MNILSLQNISCSQAQWRRKGRYMKKQNKRKKLKPDVALKEFFRKLEYFADVFNGVCFQGKLVIKPEHLVEIDIDVSLTRRK